MNGNDWSNLLGVLLCLLVFFVLAAPFCTPRQKKTRRH
jgi:biopolymer transport protein ExbD